MWGDTHINMYDEFVRRVCNTYLRYENLACVVTRHTSVMQQQTDSDGVREGDKRNMSCSIQRRNQVHVAKVLILGYYKTLAQGPWGAIAGILTLGILEFNYLTSQVHTYTQKKAASYQIRPYFVYFPQYLNKEWCNRGNMWSLFRRFKQYVNVCRQMCPSWISWHLTGVAAAEEV